VDHTAKPLNWLHGEVKTPPFSEEARQEMGALLRQLQRGDLLGMPHSRPMPSIGPRCHELRVKDANAEWRLIYRLDVEVIPVVEVFAKTTARTPQPVVALCRKRLADYDRAVAEAESAAKKENKGQPGRGD
jgi:phage-related protein